MSLSFDEKAIFFNQKVSPENRLQKYKMQRRPFNLGQLLRVLLFFPTQK